MQQRDGGQTLEDGQEQQKDGRQTLEDGQVQQRDGGQTLEDGQVQQRDGGQTLEDGRQTLEDGQVQQKDGRQTHIGHKEGNRQEAFDLKVGFEETCNAEQNCNEILDAQIWKTILGDEYTWPEEGLGELMLTETQTWEEGVSEPLLNKHVSDSEPLLNKHVSDSEPLLNKHVSDSCSSESDASYVYPIIGPEKKKKKRKKKDDGKGTKRKKGVQMQNLDIDSDDYDSDKKVEVQRRRKRKWKRRVLLSDESSDSASDSDWCKMKDEQQEQETEENETSDNFPPPSKKSKSGKKCSPGQETEENETSDNFPPPSKKSKPGKKSSPGQETEENETSDNFPPPSKKSKPGKKSSPGQETEENETSDNFPPPSKKSKPGKKSSPEFKRKIVQITEQGKIFIRRLTDNLYNQVHSCFFCGEILTNISKHLKTHKNEEEVKEIVECDGSEKVKQAKWSMLRNKGDNQHNLKVLSEGTGEIILGRRTFESVNLKDYGPCPGCLQWLKLDKTMFNHQKICPSQQSAGASKGELRIKSQVISGRLESKASKLLIEEVFPIMTPDSISSTAQRDQLIVLLGNHWLSRNIGNNLKRKYYTSSRMREAARLLINGREITKEENLTMSDLLRPENFDSVTRAALTTASPGFDDEEDLEAPSTAIRLGYDIKRMLNAKWADGIKENDEKSIRDSKSFMKLMKMEWATKVTKLATVTLQIRSFNKEKSLPDPKDIVKIQKKIRQDIQAFDDHVNTTENFRIATRIAQARLLLYNKRRSGEVEGIR